MKFIDRKEELARIQRFLRRSEPGFAVVYGRRRCGKSALLGKALGPKDIYFQADQQEAVLQRKQLAKEFIRYIPEIDQLSFEDWTSFFRTISARIKSPKTLVLDEFPYMVKSSPELPSVLQRLIDRGELSFHLIVCGSAQQLMHGLVLDKNEPLYGRAHEIIKVLPLKVGYIQQAFPDLTTIQCIEEYATWGGVPRYWRQRADFDDLWTAVDHLILDPDALFHEEPIRLLADDLRSSVQAYSILQMIGNGVHKISEIGNRLEKHATALSRPFQQLQDLNMIRRDLPFGESEKSSKRGIYKMADPFLEFYFRFVHPHRSVLNAGLKARVLEKIKSDWPLFVSNTYEHIVRQAIPHSNCFGIEWDLAQRWWPGAGDKMKQEIDIIATSSDHKSILIGEVKWENKSNLTQLYTELDQKIENLQHLTKNKKVYRAIFLKSEPKNATQLKGLSWFDADWVLDHNK